jgi:acetamidase/formamidase
MQTASRDHIYLAHSRLNQPAITVSPGEVFAVETELCSGPWLQSLTDQYDPARTVGPNPAVVIAVSGARPGERLAVHIHAIEPDELGYTGFVPPANPLSGQILDRTWGRTVRTLAIRDGSILWNDRLSIPVKPMIGTLGTAPAGDPIPNSTGGRHGGNMDVQEVCAGSTVYLPVAVPGALLHVGDVHAIQGDGEINMAGGVECRARVRLSVDRLAPASMQAVRIENESSLCSVACEQAVEASFHLAARDLLTWMMDDYGFTAEEAYLLLGQVMEARCTQFVNPTRSYICKIDRRFLVRGSGG